MTLRQPGTAKIKLKKDKISYSVLEYLKRILWTNYSGESTYDLAYQRHCYDYYVHLMEQLKTSLEVETTLAQDEELLLS